MNGGRRTAAGRIRVIGGSLRNSRLDVPELPGLRPTPERVRETLFNWLAPVIGGARCLDLWPALARQLEQGGWLAARGWVYVESPRGDVPVLPPNWQLHREGQAGEVRFALYRRALPLS